MVINRILQYLEEREITKYRFCKDIGVSKGFLATDRAIGTDKCELILENYPDLNPTWLLTGKGEMIIQNTEPIDKRIQTILELREEDQQHIFNTVDALISHLKK